MWLGNVSTPDEHTIATNIATILAGDYNGSGGREVVEIPEGSEPEEFWAALGGRGDYPAVAPGNPIPKEPRFFQASNAKGYFDVEEVGRKWLPFFWTFSSFPFLQTVG